MTESPATRPSPSLPTGSIREQPSSTIEAVILLPNLPGETLRRARAILSMPGYFKPEASPTEEAAHLEEFVRALEDFPDWAVQRGFDRWAKTMQRRPSPAEIAVLAQREVEPYREELARRARIEAAMREEREDEQRDRVTPEATARILKEFGFTDGLTLAVKRMPMAGPDKIGAMAQGVRGGHWSDAIKPGHENDAEAIRLAKINAGVADS